MTEKSPSGGYRYKKHTKKPYQLAICGGSHLPVTVAKGGPEE